MKSLKTLSGLQIGKLVNSRKLSPVEVIQYFISRIQDRDEQLNAFTFTYFDEALKQAHIQESLIAKGEYLGPFAGVPVALKDFLPSKKGWLNSHGGVEALIRRDDEYSMFCKCAESLGAIPIGKTNAPAFGFSGACSNKLFGRTNNPFDLSRTSGGSSGGSAAAVADCLVTIAEGGDAGGSIRIPAGWCNLFGFKPSLGTIPSYCRPDGWTATHPYCFNGCLTRNVEDSAVMLTAMAQYNPRDPISLPINENKDFVQSINSDIKGKKFGLTLDFNLYETDPEIRTIINNTAKKFEDAGAIVEPVEFHFKHSLYDMAYCWAWAISLDTCLDIEQWKSEGLDLIKDYSDQLPKEFIYFNNVASKVNLHDMRTFNEIRTDILDNFEDIFEDHDFILSPVAECKPFKHSEIVTGKKAIDTLDFIKFGETFLVNFVGYPAASVPAGLTKDNLPTGIQIIGKQYHDESVLAASHVLEKLQPWNYDIPLSRIV